MKTLMYDFYYEFMQSKYECKIKLCYMDTGSMVCDIQTEEFYKDTTKNIGKRFDTSEYSKDGNRSLPVGKNKKVLGMMKNELGVKIMTNVVVLRAKMYAYRKMDKKLNHKRCKSSKKFVVDERRTL